MISALYHDEAWLRFQYEHNGLSLSEVADRVGCSTSTVWNWLRRFGIPRHSQGHPIADERGRVYGRLKVMAYAGTDRWKSALWKCQCDCGNETVVSGSVLRRGDALSCGCIREEWAAALGHSTAHDVTGQRFGRLLALEATKRRNAAGSVVWKCRCDCGEIHYAALNTMRDGGVTSCGCAWRDAMKQLRGENNPNWKDNATERNWSLRLTQPYLRWRWAVLKRDRKSCQICGMHKGSLVVHHLDSFMDHPDKRTEMSNGITLCWSCHQAFHSQYGNGGNTSEQFEEFTNAD